MKLTQQAQFADNQVKEGPGGDRRLELADKVKRPQS